MDRNHHQRFSKRKWVKECSVSPDQKSSQKTSKITKKRVTGFVLVKFSDFKDKENAPQSTNKEKRSHTQKTKIWSGYRFLVCKTGR